MADDELPLRVGDHINAILAVKIESAKGGPQLDADDKLWVSWGSNEEFRLIPYTEINQTIYHFDHQKVKLWMQTIQHISCDEASIHTWWHDQSTEEQQRLYQGTKECRVKPQPNAAAVRSQHLSPEQDRPSQQAQPLSSTVEAEGPITSLEPSIDLDTRLETGNDSDTSSLRTSPLMHHQDMAETPQESMSPTFTAIGEASAATLLPSPLLLPQDDHSSRSVWTMLYKRHSLSDHSSNSTTAPVGEEETAATLSAVLPPLPEQPASHGSAVPEGEEAFALLSPPPPLPPSPHEHDVDIAPPQSPEVGATVSDDDRIPNSNVPAAPRRSGRQRTLSQRYHTNFYVTYGNSETIPWKTTDDNPTRQAHKPKEAPNHDSDGPPKVDDLGSMQKRIVATKEDEELRKRRKLREASKRVRMACEDDHHNDPTWTKARDNNDDCDDPVASNSDDDAKERKRKKASDDGMAEGKRRKSESPSKLKHTTSQPECKRPKKAVCRNDSNPSKNAAGSDGNDDQDDKPRKATQQQVETRLLKIIDDIGSDLQKTSDTHLRKKCHESLINDGLKVALASVKQTLTSQFLAERRAIAGHPTVPRKPKRTPKSASRATSGVDHGSESKRRTTVDSPTPSSA